MLLAQAVEAELEKLAAEGGLGSGVLSVLSATVRCGAVRGIDCSFARRGCVCASFSLKGDTCSLPRVGMGWGSFEPWEPRNRRTKGMKVLFRLAAPS